MSLVVTSAARIEGRPVTDHLGVVAGEAMQDVDVQPRCAVRGLFRKVSKAVGVPLHTYDELIRAARKTAVGYMQQQAEEMGADAVVSVRFHYTTVSEAHPVVLISVTGTAVKLG